jgi:ABC-2 type transport system permease protein
VLANIFSQQNRSLLRELVATDFKLRYQGSVLGYFWSLLRPLMMFAILYVVFTQVFRLGDNIPNYPVYLLLGVVMWSFFAESTVLGMNSIVARGDLLRKVNIPKYSIVVSTVLSAFVNLSLNLIVVAVFLIVAGVPITWQILYLPLLLLELLVVAFAFAFLLSALFVKYRDISHIWEVVLQGMFYATPIIYPLSIVPESLAKIISLSPLAQIIQQAREVTITNQTTTPPELLGAIGWIVPFGAVGALSIIAFSYFKSRAAKFAEEM